MDPAERPGASFLAEPVVTDAVRALYDDDVEEMGFVMNVSRLWGLDPTALDGLFELMGRLAHAGGLSFVDRAVVVVATAAARGDSYCALAWGGKLAARTSAEVSAGVLAGDDAVLGDRGRALAAWARQVVTDPNATTASDVAALRSVGFDDAQVLALTAFAALRMAFSTVNDALGGRPDPELRDALPPAVRDAVTWGRPVAP